MAGAQDLSPAPAAASAPQASITAGVGQPVASAPYRAANAELIAFSDASATEWEKRVRRGLDGTRDKHGFPGYRPGSKHMRVRTTAYTHTEADHIEYGAMSAANTRLRHGQIRSCAADWSVYPLGTTFRVRGMPYVFVVDDYGSALVGTYTIDFYAPTKAVMDRWGLRTVDIEVVRWGSYERSAEILADRRHHAHCRQMFDTISRKRRR